MKKILCIFLALVLCLGLAGTASAFQIAETAVVTPNGVLGAGESVNATMDITFAAGSMGMGKDLILSTNLVSPVWTTKVYNGNIEITSREDIHQTNTISGYLLGYPNKITLKIQLTGKVSPASAGTSICVLSIEQEDAGVNEESSFSTPLQYVYNPSDLSSDISLLNSEISALESRISSYSSYSGDFTAAKQYLASAKTDLSNAQSYGTSDFRNAMTAMSSAEVYIDSAEKSVASVVLSLVKLNTNTVDSTISKLTSNGHTSEATLLSTANQGVKNSYNSALASFNAGNIPDADSIFKDSLSILNVAQNYLSLGTTPTKTVTVTPSQTVTALPSVTATQTQTFTGTQTQTPSPVQTVVISFPNLFGSSEQIILIESVIIVILAGVIIVNILIIKRLWKKNKGGKRGRNSDEL